jgi:16S rRNA (uracil1498-N3)-methyltransferase
MSTSSFASPLSTSFLLPRFFVPATLVPGVAAELPIAVMHHINVKRLKPGSAIILFNGQGGEFIATLDFLPRGNVVAHIQQHANVERELGFQFTLAQAIVSSDKMDWVVEKLVELGGSALVPVQSARSVERLTEDRIQRRQTHWSGIVQAASEQCGRNTLTSVLPVSHFSEFIASHHNPTRLLASPKAHTRLADWAQRNRDQRDSSLTLLVGPEGGFDDREQALAIDAGYLPVSLGERVLRTETAGLTALAMLQGVWS